MRSLTATLEAAGKSASRAPYVQALFDDYVGDRPRLRFTRYYTGAETDNYAACCVAGDGSLVRARVDAGNVYVSRVAAPGSGSTYSSWTSLVACAGAGVALVTDGGATVRLFYVHTDGVTLREKVSADSGASWGAAADVTAVGGGKTYVAASYGGADTVVFWSEGATVYRSRRTAGAWGARTAWTLTIASCTGLAVEYQGDYSLVVCGTAPTSTDAKVWACIFGDGLDQALNTWSALVEIATAVAGSTVVFQAPAVEYLGCFRAFFVEVYGAGAGGYVREHWTTLDSSLNFKQDQWAEPVGFDYAAAFGLAAASSATAMWLVAAAGVWYGAYPAAGVPGTLGSLAVGGVVDVGDRNYMSGSKFTMGGSPAGVSSVSVYVDVVDAAPDNLFQVAIYADAGGSPGALVAASASGSLVGRAWNTLAISASLSASTTYWLMYNANGTSSAVNDWAYDHGAGGSGAYRAQAFGSWPASCGAVTSVDYVISIYATFVGAYDASADLLEATAELSPEGAKIRLVLDNSSGRYAVGGAHAGDVGLGRRLALSWGYRTTAGIEVSTGPGYWVTALEQEWSARSVATVVVEARDGWLWLDSWRARRQLQWAAGAKTVNQLLTYLFARAGLILGTDTSSAAIAALTPAFTVHPGESGSTAVRRLLAKVPDRLRMRSGRGAAMYPQSGDGADYTYGTTHALTGWRFRDAPAAVNRARVTGAGVFKEAFDFAESDVAGELVLNVDDQGIASNADATDRAGFELRAAQLEADGSVLVVPVNAGQELYDVVAVTAALAGLSGALRRVQGLTWRFAAARGGRYELELVLGTV